MLGNLFQVSDHSSMYRQVINHSSNFFRTFFHLGEDEQFWKKCSDPFPPKLLIYNWKNVCYISTTDLDKNESSFGWFRSCFPLPNLGDFVCLHLVFYYLHWVSFLLSPNFDRGSNVCKNSVITEKTMLMLSKNILRFRSLKCELALVLWQFLVLGWSFSRKHEK